MKIIQKKMVKNITKRFTTEIIQESTDAIYQFEDDSISLADVLLKEVLVSEMTGIVQECLRNEQEYDHYNRSNFKSNGSMEFEAAQAGTSHVETGHYGGYIDADVPNEGHISSNELLDK